MASLTTRIRESPFNNSLRNMKEKNGYRNIYSKRQHMYKKHKGNVKEGQGFALQRKQVALKEYRKLLKKEKRNYSSLKEDGVSSEGNYNKIQTSDWINKKTKPSIFQRAQEKIRLKEEEAKKKREEAAKVQEAKRIAIKNYKEQKRERLKKLSQKTHRGQPVMKGRIELLLEKIQKQMVNS